MLTESYEQAVKSGRASDTQIDAATPEPKPKPTYEEYMAELRRNPRFRVLDAFGRGVRDRRAAAEQVNWLRSLTHYFRRER
jgi:hypothetical protein